MAEAEYMELTETAKQAAWLRSFSQEICRSPTHPTTICADNKAATFLATNPAQHVKTYHYVEHGGGKAPRLSEVHCDWDSVCVKTDT